MTECQLKPWGAACEQDAAGLIRDRDGKTHPACRWHLWAAEEFDWQPVPLDEVVAELIRPTAEKAIGVYHLFNQRAESVELDFDDDRVLPLHRAGTFPTICPICDGGGCFDCTDPAN